MVLLEELLDIESKGISRIKFVMNENFYDVCSGNFRKNISNHYIDRDNLVKDFLSFHEDEMVYFDELFEHLRKDVKYKKEKFRTAVFNQLILFLEYIEDNTEEYLIGYEGPQIIYNANIENEYFEEYYIYEDAVFTPMLRYEDEEEILK